MKKISFVVLLIILIVNAFSSDCTDKTINSNIVPTSQVASGTQSGNENEQPSQGNGGSQSGNENEQPSQGNGGSQSGNGNEQPSQGNGGSQSGNGNEQPSQGNGGSQSGNENEQESQSQSGNVNQQEVASSEIDSDSKSETSDSSSTQAAEGGRLRLLNSLTNDDCKNLKTSDDSKYQCAVKADKTGCEEVDKESSKILYLSFSFLIIFILL